MCPGGFRFTLKCLYGNGVHPYCTVHHSEGEVLAREIATLVPVTSIAC